jgi:hypothetical protein
LTRPRLNRNLVPWPDNPFAGKDAGGFRERTAAAARSRMAKSKHSTALFEVMARSKAYEPPDGGGPGILDRVRGWLKRPSRGRPAGAADLNPAPAASDDMPVISYSPSAPSRNSFEVDPDRRVVAVRLSYSAALVCVLAVGTTVAAAYMAGRRTDLFQKPLLGSISTRELREQPPQPAVVEVGNRDGYRNAFDERETAVPNPNVKPPERQKPAAPPDGTVAPQTPAGRKRTPDLNYVIIQGYPEEAMAKAAQALLAQNGIETTIERKLPGWPTPTPWFSVVGVHGFSRISNSPDLDAYMDKIRKISAQHHRNRSFKAFDPKAYKWQK